MAHRSQSRPGHLEGAGAEGGSLVLTPLSAFLGLQAGPQSPPRRHVKGCKSPSDKGTEKPKPVSSFNRQKYTPRLQCMSLERKILSCASGGTRVTEGNHHQEQPCKQTCPESCRFLTAQTPLDNASVTRRGNGLITF